MPKIENPKKRENFLDTLLWICLGWMLLWLILKVTGVLQTPLIIEWSPAFAAVYIIGRSIQKLNVVEKTVGLIGTDLKKISSDFRKLETEHQLAMEGKITKRTTIIFDGKQYNIRIPIEFVKKAKVNPEKDEFEFILESTGNREELPRLSGELVEKEKTNT